MVSLMRIILLLWIASFFLSCATSTPVQVSHQNESSQVIDTQLQKPTKPEAILKLDTKGHTAKISDVLVSKNGDIISSSFDKTIRVFDAKTGLEKYKILGNIGVGPEGTINAIALSPNEKYLAVGGYFTDKDGGNQYIRIYDYQTRKLIKILFSHTDVVLDLDFSSDGRYLISGSVDKSAKIWDVINGFELKDTIKYHTGVVHCVKIVHYKNKDYALSVGYNDKQVALYDIQKKSISQSYKAKHRLSYIASNSNHIAVSGLGHDILIFDMQLNLIQSIENKIEPAGLAYSPNGKSLMVGSASFPSSVNIYNARAKYKKISSFLGFNNMAFKVNFINDTTAVSGGGDDKEIYIWDIYTNKIKNKIAGVGKNVWSVNLEGDTIEWGNIADRGGVNHFASLQKSMNLKNFTISYLPSLIKKTIPTVNGRYSLSSSKGGENGYRNAVLNIKKDGVIITSILRDSGSGSVHRCYGWYKNYIISGGVSGSLNIYNIKGIHVASLIGHTATVWGIGLDGDRLISGSGDQTMMIWDLSKLQSLHEPLQINMNYVKSFMQGNGVTKEEVILASQQVGVDDIYVGSHINPLVKIFVSKKNEYVVWTDDGFFDASKKGANYVGYHINQGINRESEYISVDALYSTFYRPDLIQKALNGESLKKYARNINIDALLQNGLAPEVHILTKTKNTNKEDLILKVQVCPKGDGGYDNLTLMINSIPVSVINTARALKLKKKSKRNDCFIYKQNISLISGVNNIGVKATNKTGNIESKPDFLEVNFDNSGIKKEVKNRFSKMANQEDMNDLHILAIAVNKYKDKELQLKYSINDATQMLQTIQDVATPLFHHVYTYKLFDKDVTKENIQKAFKSIKSTRKDVFLLYIAGHGITDEYNGNYYYIPYDFKNIESISAVQDQGVGQKDLMLGLSSIVALKSLVLLDTCNSGSFVEANIQKTTTNRLARATGRATISASSKSQMALEGYKGHGVFTYTLIEALKGKGYGKNNKITVNELSKYLKDVLPRRTYNKWGYKQIPQSSMYGTDFNLGVK